MSEKERPVDDVMSVEPYNEENEQKEPAGDTLSQQREYSSDDDEGSSAKGLDAIKYYLKEIRKTPLLTFEQEQELAKKIAQGDGDARARMIESNLRHFAIIRRPFNGPLGRGVAQLGSAHRSGR